MPEPPFPLRRLGPDDAAAFRALRLAMFARHPGEFRYTPADEAATSLAATAERLATSYVVGAFHGDAPGAPLVGVAGLTRQTGEKLRHTALLWGMYVAEPARGTGLGDRLVADVLAHAAQEGIARVVLTVMANNARAERLYARWGFARYGVDPGAVLVDGVPRDEALMVRHLRA